MQFISAHDIPALPLRLSTRAAGLEMPKTGPGSPAPGAFRFFKPRRPGDFNGKAYRFGISSVGQDGLPSRNPFGAVWHTISIGPWK